MRRFILLVCCAPLLSFQPAETVDFSLPPREGLKLRVEKTVEWRGWFDESHRTKKRVERNYREVFEQQFTKLADGRVVSVERQYRKTSTRPKLMEGCKTETAPERAGVQMRATWNAGRCRIEVKDGGEWTANKSVASGVCPAELRSPILPLGDGVRRVGDTWYVDAKPLFVALGGRVVPGDSWLGGGTIRLVRIESDPHGQPGRRAVLAVTLRARRTGPSCRDSHLLWSGTADYDLAHRVVSRCEGSGYTGVWAFDGGVSGSLKTRAATRILVRDL